MSWKTLGMDFIWSNAVAHKFFKNLGVNSKFSAPKGRNAVRSVLSTHRYKAHPIQFSRPRVLASGIMHHWFNLMHYTAVFLNSRNTATIKWPCCRDSKHVSPEYRSENCFPIIWYAILWYDTLLTANGLTPGGSNTVHIYTQTTHRTTQWNTIPRTVQT